MNLTRVRDQAEAKSPVAEAGAYRWRICALLFFATTINYIDRQVLGVLAPYLQPIIGWNEIQYGYIVTSFQAAYAVGLLLVGGVIDRLGARIGYAIAISIWSLAAMGHALVQSVIGFAVARFALGLGESANFPAAVKTVAEWFPRKERALATGIFNSGSNVGAIVAPLTVPWITLRFGWHWAFVFTGLFSAAWLIAWLAIYRPGLAPAQSDAEESASRIPWAHLLAYRQTWAFLLGKFITDPVWWFLIFWLPKFLNSEYGLTLTDLGPPLVAIYLMADCGSIAGGWIASVFLKRGWSANRARKSTMLICATSVVPINRVNRPGRGSAPGLVGELVHAGFGYVPAPCSGVCGRDRRLRRRRRRHAGRHLHRIPVAVHRQLRAAVCDGQLSLPAGAGDDPRPGSKAGARPRRLGFGRSLFLIPRTAQHRQTRVFHKTRIGRGQPAEIKDTSPV